MTANAVPTAGSYPLKHNKREAKVIETARSGLAVTGNASIVAADLAAGSIILAKLAAGISPSHVVKFARFGAGITTTALAGLAVNDIVVLLTPGAAGAAAISVALVAVANTLPSDPADTDFIIVLRAAA